MAYIGKIPAPVALTGSDLAADIITAAKIADDAISEEHLDATVVTGLTALGATPADTDELIISDAGTLKRVDYSHLKSTPGLNLIKEVTASNVSAVTFVHGTSDVVFDSTYKVYFLTMTNVILASDEELFLRALSNGSALTSGYWSAQGGAYGQTTPNDYADRYQDSFMGSPGDVESDHPFNGYAYFFNAGGSSIHPVAMGQIQMQRSNNNYYGFSFSGSYNTAISDFNGFTLTNNGGGNISSGNFKLYGVS